jgi:hypothetical protein
MRVSSMPTPAGDPLMVVAQVARGDEAVAVAHATEDRQRAHCLSSAMQKSGAHSRAEAVQVAEDKGWL